MVNTDAGECSATVNFAATETIGITTVTATVTDGASNTNQCTFSVTVNACPSASATVIYVDQDATTGNNDCTSWSDAFIDLQMAMDAAVSCGLDSIWVAEGTYLPTSSPDEISTNPRDRAFHLDQDLKIFGGFDGTETQFSQRDVEANVTILSGDFNGDDDFDVQNGGYQNSSGDDNAFRVFITANLTNDAELDGFSLRGGNADVSPGAITYRGQSFLRSAGGGMFNMSRDPTVTNCIFGG